MDELREKYIRACKFKSSLEQNFVRSHVNTSVGFIGTAPLESQISVLDDDFNILLSYDVKAYIGACTISDDGNYIAWQTANSNTDDGNSICLFDVNNNQMMFQIEANVHIKHIVNIFLETIENGVLLHCHYNTGDITYTSDGNIKTYNIESTEALVSKGLVSAYALLNEAELLISTLCDEFHIEISLQASKKIEAAIHSKNGVSAYQSAVLYKRLADVLLTNNYKEQALLYYKKGLELNSKLPVKRIVKQLESKK